MQGLEYISPASLIRAGERAHPAFKYAVAAAGLGGLVAVVARYGVSPATLVFGSIILVVLMVLFLVFSQAAVVAHAVLATPALVLVWCFLILSILTALFLFTSAFFDVPLPVRSFLVRQLQPIQHPDQLRPATAPTTHSAEELKKLLGDRYVEMRRVLDTEASNASDKKAFTSVRTRIEDYLHILEDAIAREDMIRVHETTKNLIDLLKSEQTKKILNPSVAAQLEGLCYEGKDNSVMN